MTKEKAEMIVNLVNTGSHNAYDETRIWAYIPNYHIANEEEFEVEVIPATMNTSKTLFYHIEVIGNIAQGLNIHCYAKIKNEQIVIEMY